jgi:poly [ADP-ribose] polymerase
MSKKAFKGHLVDEYCKVNGTLFEYKDKVYSCILNQTDIDANKNKFYIMQLIKNGSNLTHFMRYGRTGEMGRTTEKVYSSEQEAITAFEKQFKTKTGNSWANKEFTKKEGRYFMTYVSYEKELGDKIPQISIPDSILDKKVQKLIEMLSDINMMQSALVSLDIDTKKMPLGKISQTQLDKADVVLDKIQELVKQISQKGTTEKLIIDLGKLSSEYYTYVPISCGRKKPPLINSNELLAKYKDTVDELKNMVITVQITNNIKVGENPIDSIYKDINTTIVPLEKNGEMWNEILKYFMNTHGPTHGCKLEVLEIFEIEQIGKKKTFENYCHNIDNHMLLFHGSPQNCILSILKRDFYLDPGKIKDINIQIAGKLFGYGVYFADCCSKSMNYCRAHATNDIGCFIMAEIALGNTCTKNEPDYDINKTKLEKTKHHSVKGVGKYEPSTTTQINNIKIPNGKIADINKNTYLKYNEYIVYDINQVLIKYLVVAKNSGNYIF